MSLKIRYQGGPDAGKTLSFGDEVVSVLVGRDPGKCQVVFSANDTHVGREHFAITKVLGRYRLMLDQEHVVLVNGKEAYHEEELPEIADVEVGRGGPKLVIETMAAAGGAAMLPTVGRENRPGAGTELRETGARSRKGLHAAMVAVVLIGIAAIVGYSLHEKSEEENARTEAANKKTNELAMEAHDMGAAATSQAYQASAKADVASVSVVNLKGGFEQVTTEMAAATQNLASVEEQIGKLDKNWQKVLLAAEPSVYQVIKKDAASGAEYAEGTAWVVGPGMLATNAHVADLFTPEADKMYVRSNEKNPVTMLVTNAKMHPGYNAFEGLIKKYGPAENDLPGDFTPMNYIPACDVGLLYVGDKDAKKLMAPLTLAPVAEASQLKQGDELGAEGYPVEAMTGGTIEHPQPLIQTGIVNRVSDYLMNPTADPSTTLLVHHTLPGAGGASGSPMLNLKGEVVCVYCASNFYFTNHEENGHVVQDRIAMAVGENFAQRVDVLHELIDGTADEAIVPRVKAWEDAIKAKPSISMKYVMDEVGKWMGDDATHVAQQVTSESDALVAGATDADMPVFTKQFNLPQIGDYCFVLITDGGDNVKLSVQDLTGTVLGTPDTATDLQSVPVTTSKKKTELNVVVTGTTADQKGNTFMLYEFRRINKPAGN